MKKLIQFGILLICFTFIGCATNETYYRNHANQDLLQESWMQRVNTNPNLWTRSADRWFFTAQPNQLLDYALHKPISSNMTHSMVRTGPFTDIKINGDFQVQLVGGQDHDTVEIIGPNAEAIKVSVETQNHTLCVNHVIMDPKAGYVSLHDVVVRIGIRRIRSITTYNIACITGINILSNRLAITSYGTGNILLGGRMNVTSIMQRGPSTITVIGAYTPSLNIINTGGGMVKVKGRVGVQSIYNNGRVNIIGADSNSLNISAFGTSITEVSGYVNLKKINACDNSRVYLYWINSKNLFVNQTGCAVVGLAGCAINLTLHMSGESRFQGSYLRTQSAYVRMQDKAHANAAASEKFFAEASDNSSIYFLGSPSIGSRFISENATIIPIWTNDLPSPAVRMRQPYTWSFNPNRDR